MNKNFREDYYRMTGSEYKFNVQCMVKSLLSHQIMYMYLWRKLKSRENIMVKSILRLYSRKYGIEISQDAQIGRGIYLGHAYNITIGNGAILGDNVNLHKGCTIGKENRGKRKGAPNIGNNVAVGINSTIIGNIKIGNDVMIAANAFVNFDVPDHSIVLGNPGVIHLKENATEGYIGFCV